MESKFCKTLAQGLIGYDVVIRNWLASSVIGKKFWWCKVDSLSKGHISKIFTTDAISLGKGSGIWRDSFGNGQRACHFVLCTSSPWNVYSQHIPKGFNIWVWLFIQILVLYTLKVCLCEWIIQIYWQNFQCQEWRIDVAM